MSKSSSALVPMRRLAQLRDAGVADLRDPGVALHRRHPAIAGRAEAGEPDPVGLAHAQVDVFGSAFGDTPAVSHRRRAQRRAQSVLARRSTVRLTSRDTTMAM